MTALEITLICLATSFATAGWLVLMGAYAVKRSASSLEIKAEPIKAAPKKPTPKKAPAKKGKGK